LPKDFISHAMALRAECSNSERATTDRRQYRQRPELADNFEHSLTRRAEAALQHIAHHQRPGIDKGVTRFTLFNFQLKQRVKGLAGRIFTHALPDLIFFTGASPPPDSALSKWTE
jgi:hypothetical protein